MATIANLAVGLSADSAQLKRDLDKAKADTRKWSSQQKKQFDGVAKSVRLIGVAIAGIGFASLVRGVSAASRELEVMANLTGETTTDLQRVTPSLERAGLSMEKYADILKDVNDKTHDYLQSGAGPMADFFENIAPLVGVTKEAFADLSGSEALGLYVSSLEQAGLSQEQMTFYMEALASDSTRLLPLLRNNAEGMDEFALATNQVISRETIKTINDITTSFRTLGTIITNMSVEAIAPLLKFISGMLDGWRKLITDYPKIVTAFQLITVGVVGLTVAMRANPFTLWVTAIAGVVAALGFLYDKFDVFKELIPTAIKLGAIKMKMFFLDALRDMLVAFESMTWDVATGLNDVFGTNLQGATIVGGPMNQNTGINKTILDTSYALQNASNAYSEAVAKLTDGDPLSVVVENSNLPDLTGGGGGGPTPNTPEQKDFYQTTADQFVSGLKSSFTTALASGDWKGFLNNVLDSFTMGVISSFTEGLFKPFQDSLTSWMGGLMNSMGSLGGGAGGGLMGFLGPIFGFAKGGIVPTTSTSKSYADSVPALLQPGELVVPKSEVENFMNGGGRGSGQVFNINVTGDVSRATRAEIVRMMPEIAAGTNMMNRENGIA